VINEWGVGRSVKAVNELKGSKGGRRRGGRVRRTSALPLSVVARPKVCSVTPMSYTTIAQALHNTCLVDLSQFSSPPDLSRFRSSQPSAPSSSRAFFLCRQLPSSLEQLLPVTTSLICLLSYSLSINKRRSDEPGKGLRISKTA
jgi:hypothetical protein